MKYDLEPNGEEIAVRKMDSAELTPHENEFFHCSWEWHIARLSSVCALIYPLAFSVSGGKQTKLADRRFFASSVSLATYFRYSASQVRRGLKELELAGFFQLIARKRFRPTQYRVFAHDEWAEKHKGECTSKVVFPWTGEGDPLGQSLWKISGGTVKFAEFQIRNLRKLGLADSEIEEKFSVYWEETAYRMSPKNVPAGFYKVMNPTIHGKQKCAA